MNLTHKPNEIPIFRTYNAPINKVWEAWVDPKQVGEWWGPRGFTITTKRKDVRTGGDWLYTMHGPDGTDYPNHTQFLEVETGKRLVYDHGGFEDRPPMFRVTVSFSEKNGKTEMEMTMGFPSAEEANQARVFIKSAGGDATWDRLAEFLEKQSTGKEIFVINRSMETNLKTIYHVWTNKDHLLKWLGPTGFTGTFHKADMHVGGETFYSMTNGDLTMYGKTKYLELEEPNRIVYLQNFADKDGNISRHPMSPTWPETMKTTVSFQKETSEQTRITIEWEVFGNATTEEYNTFKEAKAGMTQGWTGSLDKLEEYLQSI